MLCYKVYLGTSRESNDVVPMCVYLFKFILKECTFDAIPFTAARHADKFLLFLLPIGVLFLLPRLCACFAKYPLYSNIYFVYELDSIHLKICLCLPDTRHVKTTDSK